MLRLDAATQHSRAELIDPSGKVQFTWPVDYSRLVKGGSAEEFPHASDLLPDGSILVSFDDGHALARLAVPEGFIRLSVGVEPAEPLWAAIAAALKG